MGYPPHATRIEIPATWEELKQRDISTDGEPLATDEQYRDEEIGELRAIVGRIVSDELNAAEKRLDV